MSQSEHTLDVQPSILKAFCCPLLQLLNNQADATPGLEYLPVSRVDGLRQLAFPTQTVNFQDLAK